MDLQNKHGERTTLIVGCRNNCQIDLLNKDTNVSSHQHLGKNFYIDKCDELQPDLIIDFLKITEDDIPDNCFDTVYFEYMTNSMMMNNQSDFGRYLSIAYRILKPGGMVAFDGSLKFNLYMNERCIYYNHLNEAKFVTITNRYNMFNDRSEGKYKQHKFVSAKKPLVKN